MVCDRCIRVVREELEKLGYKTENVILGEAHISSDKKQFDINKIKTTMEENGFELIDDKQAKLIEDIKIALIDLIHYKSANELEKISLSKFLSEKFHHSYQHISSLFSSKEGITIEKYFFILAETFIYLISKNLKILIPSYRRTSAPLSFISFCYCDYYFRN